MSSPDDILMLADEALDTSRDTVGTETADAAAPFVPDGTFIVPPEHLLTIDLPAMPPFRRELRRMIADRAPLLPRYLAWTAPAPCGDGTAAIAIARRDWLDVHVGRMERATEQILDAYAAPGMRRLRYRSPAARRAWAITLALWGAAILALLGTCIAVWAMDDITPGAPVSPPVPTAAYAPNAGITATIEALQPDALPSEGLVALAGLPDGTIRVEMETGDPDELRRTIRANEDTVGLAEVGQAQQNDGRFRVTYRLKTTGLQVANAAKMAAVLRAANRSEAIEAVQARLTREAASWGLQLSVLAPSNPSDGRLQFDIDLTGPQNDVLSAANAMESEGPPMRFDRWRLEPAATGGAADVRMSGTLQVPWAVRR